MLIQIDASEVLVVLAKLKRLFAHAGQESGGWILSEINWHDDQRF